MLEIYKEIVKVVEGGGEAALVTVISASESTPREAGSKMLVKADGSIAGSIGGGKVEAMAIKQALNVMKTGKPEKRSFNLNPEKAEEAVTICGGEMEVFIEPVNQSPIIYIFGGGHIALALAKLGKMVGFRIAVIDDRPEFACEERFPQADRILAESYEQAIPKLNFNELSYIVIVTPQHKYDEQVLGLVLDKPAKYTGMIGSRAKVKTIFEHLTEKGADKNKLQTVHTPIGLDIGAETPEEIAVAIIAEIIKVFRG